MRQGKSCSAEVFGALLLGLCSVLAGGCGQGSNEPAAAEAMEHADELSASELSASEVLDRMIAVYRAAKTYADSGELRQQPVRPGVP